MTRATLTSNMTRGGRLRRRGQRFVSRRSGVNAFMVKGGAKGIYSRLISRREGRNIDSIRENLNYFPKWDAQKSVKYVLAARINHDSATRGHADTNSSLYISFKNNSLILLIAQQDAFS